MWTLRSSGRVVETVIYEFARNLKHESYLHSFIISDADKDAKSIFKKEEWKEIFTNFKKMPKVDKSIIELLKKYSVTDLSSLRNVILEPFLPPDTLYSNEKHSDLNYVNLAYSIMHILWEQENDFTLDSSKLEGSLQKPLIFLNMEDMPPINSIYMFNLL